MGWSCREIRWYVRWAIRLDNLRYRMKRRAYRAHAHANARIDEMTLASGLRPSAEAFTFVWRVVLYSRDDPAPPSHSAHRPSSTTATARPQSTERLRSSWYVVRMSNCSLAVFTMGVPRGCTGVA